MGLPRSVQAIGGGGSGVGAREGQALCGRVANSGRVRLPAFAFIIPESLGVLPIRPTIMNPTTQTSPLLTREQLATALGICQMTVSRLTKARRIPFVSVGRRGKRYDREAVVLALNTNPIASTLSVAGKGESK